jgi:hypothetical protein
VSVMDPVLSLQMTVVFCGCLRSAISLRSHSPSFVAWQLVTYSAYVLDVVTVGWRFELQEIAPSLSVYTYPDVDLRVSTSLAWSELV